MINVRRAVVAALSAVVLTGGVGAATALPASAAPSSCSSWNDSNTFGGSCNGTDGQFQAKARCNDGSDQVGDRVDYGKSSYAYCAGHGGLTKKKGFTGFAGFPPDCNFGLGGAKFYAVCFHAIGTYHAAATCKDGHIAKGATVNYTTQAYAHDISKASVADCTDYGGYKVGSGWWASASTPYHSR